MTKVADHLRVAKAHVDAQKLHDAFAEFSAAERILGTGSGGRTAAKMHDHVASELQRLLRYFKANLYITLDVHPQCKQVQVRKAYRNMAKRFHPDKNRDTQSLFIAIKEAYDTLSDPVKREAYDRSQQKNAAKKKPARHAGSQQGHSRRQRQGGTAKASGKSSGNARDELFKAWQYVQQQRAQREAEMREAKARAMEAHRIAMEEKRKARLRAAMMEKLRAAKQARAQQSWEHASPSPPPAGVAENEPFAGALWR